MTWFKVDDGLSDHPKMLALQCEPGWEQAVALWVLAGSWSARHLTDGAIPASAVIRLGMPLSAADALVKVGLWELAPSGYQFHDWLDLNPSRTEVETRRGKTTKRVAEWRAKSRNAPCNALHDVLPTPLVTLLPSRPVPSRPDPARPEGESEREDPEPTPPVDETHSQEALASTAVTVRSLHAQLMGALGTFPSQSQATARHYAALTGWANQFPDPKKALHAAFLAFREDEWAISKRYPLGALANSPDRYHVAGLPMLEDLELQESAE